MSTWRPHRLTSLEQPQFPIESMGVGDFSGCAGLCRPQPAPADNVGEVFPKDECR